MIVFEHNAYDQSLKNKYSTTYFGWTFKVDSADDKFYVYTFWNDNGNQHGLPSKHKTLELAKKRIKHLSDGGFRTEWK